QVHKRQPRYVFQTSPPYTAYAEGVLAMLSAAKAESVYLVARDDAGSREMGEAALNLARKLGFKHAALEIYSAGTVDFLPQLYRALGAHADASIDFGEARDGGDIVKSLKLSGYA